MRVCLSVFSKAGLEHRLGMSLGPQRQGVCAGVAPPAHASLFLPFRVFLCRFCVLRADVAWRVAPGLPRCPAAGGLSRRREGWLRPSTPACTSITASLPHTAPAGRLLSRAPALTWLRWHWAFLRTLAALASCCGWRRCRPSLVGSPSPLTGPASHSPPSVPSVLLEISSDRRS